jgi:hypothetical protein
MTEWCNKHPTSPLCACVRRSDNPEYTRVQGIFQFNDGCWYLPCKDSGMVKGVVPYDMRHLAGACPTDVCQQIVNITNSENINIDNLRLNIDCAPPVDGTVDPDPVPAPIEKYAMALLVGGVAVAVVGIGALIYPVVFRR